MTVGASRGGGLTSKDGSRHHTVACSTLGRAATRPLGPGRLALSARESVVTSLSSSLAAAHSARLSLLDTLAVRACNVYRASASCAVHAVRAVAQERLPPAAPQSTPLRSSSSSGLLSPDDERRAFQPGRRPDTEERTLRLYVLVRLLDEQRPERPHAPPSPARLRWAAGRPPRTARVLLLAPSTRKSSRQLRFDVSVILQERACAHLALRTPRSARSARSTAPPLLA